MLLDTAALGRRRQGAAQIHGDSELAKDLRAHLDRVSEPNEIVRLQRHLREVKRQIQMLEVYSSMWQKDLAKE